MVPRCSARVSERNDTKEQSGFEQVTEVPVHVLNTYSGLWQLETWLRTMVYVELRALLGDDWAKGLNPSSNSFQADKSLTHMPTPEMNALSYAQLSKLTGLIASHWDCFSVYLPPKDLWDAKLREVAQIRHRVAHFRVGHVDDLPRLKQFLRDIDKGFWTFCTSYNDMNAVIPQESDPIAKHFLPFDPLPWVEVEEKTWAQVGFRDKSLVVGLSVRSQRRPWCREPLEAGKPGHLYDFYMFAQDGRTFDLPYLLERTRSQHHHLVHLCFDDLDHSVRFTVPAILGEATIKEIVQSWYDAAVGACRRSPLRPPADLVDRWPEYVIGSSNPLTFLAPSMPCSFFGV